MYFLFVREAFAGGGGGEEVSMMPLIFGLILLSFTYLAAHVIVDRLQRRYLFVSGIEYVALGMGLSYLAVFDRPQTYLPAITFAIGWVGLTYGLKLALGSMLRSGAMLRLALTELFVVGLGIAAFVTFVSYSLLDQDWSTSLVCGGMLGSASLAGSASAIEVVQQRYPRLKSHLLGSLLQGAQINNLLAIMMFTLVMCTHNREKLVPHFYDSFPLQGGVILALITAVGGITLAFLYRLFLLTPQGEHTHSTEEKRKSENSRFLALTGIICFASGAAFFVNLPVIALAVALGWGLSRTHHREPIYAMMESAKKPAMLILLVFAGVQIKGIALTKVAALLSAVVLLRLLLKACSSWFCGYGSSIRSDLFRGHLSQGIISLAIALSFQNSVSGEGGDIVYAVAVLSVAINELISPRWLRGLLIDIGEIRDDISLAKEV